MRINPCSEAMEMVKGEVRVFPWYESEWTGMYFWWFGINLTQMVGTPLVL